MTVSGRVASEGASAPISETLEELRCGKGPRVHFVPSVAGDGQPRLRMADAVWEPPLANRGSLS
jgi:hypothetical protein